MNNYGGQTIGTCTRALWLLVKRRGVACILRSTLVRMKCCDRAEECSAVLASETPRPLPCRYHQYSHPYPPPEIIHIQLYVHYSINLTTPLQQSVH